MEDDNLSPDTKARWQFKLLGTENAKAIRGVEPRIFGAVEGAIGTGVE